MTATSTSSALSGSTAASSTAGAATAGASALGTRTAASTAPGSTAARTAATTGADPSIGQLAANASSHISTIIRGEIELAKTELKVSVKNGGVGAAMFVAAGVLLAFALTFAFIAIAELIHWFGLWRWASYLCVFALLAIIAGVLVLLGLRKVKKVKAPERTISTTKDTVAYLKHPTSA